MINIKYILLVCLLSFFCKAQELKPGELSFNEYIGYVKKYHPVVKQANLKVSSAQAELMEARGAFDPKIEVDYDKKEFKGTQYYSLLNSSFKIPTWYGIEIKAGFDNSEGIYVNPQNVTPNSGLTSLGINIPLSQGLFINKRMADLRAAKIQLQLGDAERKLQAATAIYDASVAYFNWKKSYDEVELYRTYYNFANVRYDGITKLIQAGDKPAIDSIEAGIIVKNRGLTLEEAQLKLAKAQLEISNYLWINDVPVQLADNIIPEKETESTVAQTLGIKDLPAEIPPIENHPKIVALESKRDIIDIERRFKANLLLPRLDISYNYLSEPSYFDNYRFEDYKIGLNFSFPLFLRKERGGLKLAKLKLQDVQLELDLERVQLKYKIEAQQAEILSLSKQKDIIDDLVNDYNKMLESEERLFSFGESSIFLINSRENSVVGAKLSQINILNRFLVSNAELFKMISNPD